MNLLFYAPQMAPYGGMERHICLLAAAAARKGHKVRFLTTSNSLGSELRAELTHPLIDFRELPLAREKAVAPGLIVATQKLTWLMFQTALARAFKPDLIYTNGQSGMASTVWRAASKRTRIIHHHHTAADKQEQATWAPAFKNVLRKADELVGCSRSTCANISEATERRRNITYLPYISRRTFEASEISERAPSDPVRFGFIGRLVKEKGIDKVLRLAKAEQMDGIEWHIHGAGTDYPPEQFSGLKRLVYHGPFASLEEHRRLLSDLDAVILLSTHNEGMPLSLMEAMSAGLPWIATDKGGTKELALSYQDSLVVPADLELGELAGACLELRQRILERKTSRLRQREIYERCFSPDVAIGAWLEFFEVAPPKN